MVRGGGGKRTVRSNRSHDNIANPNVKSGKPKLSKFVDFDPDKDTEIRLERRNVAKLKALRRKDTNKFMRLHKNETTSSLSKSQVSGSWDSQIEDENNVLSESSEMELNDYWRELKVESIQKDAAQVNRLFGESQFHFPFNVLH